MSDQPEYTKIELSKHNTKLDCWFQIEDIVYNVSEYMDEHPGGSDIIMNASGGDVTDIFNDVGHSKGAIKLMNKFRIGTIKMDGVTKTDGNVTIEDDDYTNLFVWGACGFIFCFVLRMFMVCTN